MNQLLLKNKREELKIILLLKRNCDNNEYVDYRKATTISNMIFYIYINVLSYLFHFLIDFKMDYFGYFLQ